MPKLQKPIDATYDTARRAIIVKPAPDVLQYNVSISNGRSEPFWPGQSFIPTDPKAADVVIELARLQGKDLDKYLTGGTFKALIYSSNGNMLEDSEPVEVTFELSDEDAIKLGGKAAQPKNTPPADPNRPITGAEADKMARQLRQECEERLKRFQEAGPMASAEELQGLKDEFKTLKDELDKKTEAIKALVASLPKSDFGKAEADKLMTNITELIEALKMQVSEQEAKILKKVTDDFVTKTDLNAAIAPIQQSLDEILKRMPKKPTLKDRIIGLNVPTQVAIGLLLIGLTIFGTRHFLSNGSGSLMSGNGIVNPAGIGNVAQLPAVPPTQSPAEIAAMREAVASSTIANQAVLNAKNWQDEASKTRWTLQEALERAQTNRTVAINIHEGATIGPGCTLIASAGPMSGMSVSSGLCPPPPIMTQVVTYSHGGNDGRYTVN